MSIKELNAYSINNQRIIIGFFLLSTK